MSEINIGFNLRNIGEARTKLKEFKADFEDLKQSFENAPDATEVFNQSVERALELAGALEDKIKDQNPERRNDPEFQRDIAAGLQELSAMKTLFSSGGVFDANSAKTIFSGFSEAIQKELNSVTGDIANAIRTNIRSLRSSTIGGMTRELIGTDDMQSIFNGLKTTDGKAFEQYTKMLLSRVAPTYMFDDYMLARYGSTSKGSRVATPQSLIPKSFQKSFAQHEYVSAVAEDQTGYLQPAQRKKLKSLLGENDAAMRAAELTTGLLRYNNAGKPSLAYNISPQMFDEFRQHLYEDFINRSAGSASRRIDPYDDWLSDEDTRKLAGRMTSGSAGRALKAMDAVDSFLTGNMPFTPVYSKRQYEELKKTAKPTLEQYEVLQYGIGDILSGKNGGARVSVSESPNTRMLGLQGHHNEFTDKLLLVSMDGYDKENEAHRQLLENLLSGKPVDIPGTGKKYIGQNVHGTGEGTVLRMVEATEHERVRKQEEKWAKENGFTGTDFWNDFIPADYDYENIKDLRKHYDAVGKGWSASYKSRSKFNQPFVNGRAPFGVIDLSKINDDSVKVKLADGLAWFADNVLSADDFQGRAGVSEKGTFHSLKGYKTLGEWAAAVGLLNEDGRFVLPGPRGDVDLTDLYGMTDVSQIKNLQAYNNFNTPNEFNAGYSKLLQRYNASIMATYEDANTKAKGIGTQAMAYMRLSPAMQNEQIKEYTKRLRLLDTESGIKEYLLGDPNNYLGQLVKEGKMSISNPLIQSWVQRERESLAERASAGEWIDFSGKDVVNQMLSKSPISAKLGFEPSKDRTALLKQIREAYKQKTGREITLNDEELSGVFALDPGQIVDFQQKSTDRYMNREGEIKTIEDYKKLDPDARKEYLPLVSVNRSPTGFASFVSGRNYAGLSGDIYDVFGISKNGAYMSEHDMNTIGSADYDGDRAKFIYNGIAETVKLSQDYAKELEKMLGEYADPVKKQVELAGVDNYVDNTNHKRLFVEAAIEATPRIGAASESGARAAMLDLSNPLNRDFLAATIQSNKAYDFVTTDLKDATETQLTPEMRKALYEGKAWSKLPSRYSGLFNVTGMNGAPVPSEDDIAKIDVGGREVDINLKALRDIDLDRINFRSIYSPADIAGLRQVSKNSKLGVDMTRAKALLQALDQNIGYGNAGEQTKQLMRLTRQMKVFDIMNPNRLLDDGELSQLEALILSAENEIEEQVSKDLPGVTKKERSSEIQKRKNEYGVTSARKFIERGIHRKNLINVYGQEAIDSFGDLLTYDGWAPEIPEVDLPIYLQRPNEEQLNETIRESEEEISNIDKEIAAKKAEIEKEKAKSAAKQNKKRGKKKKEKWDADTDRLTEEQKLDALITEETVRLEEAREAENAAYLAEINSNGLLDSEHAYSPLSAQDMLATIQHQEQTRIPQIQEEIKKRQATINNLLPKRDKMSISAVESDMLQQAEKELADLQQDLTAAQVTVDNARAEYDRFYSPVTSPKLEELKAKRANIGKTEKQTQLENELAELEARKSEAVESRNNAAATIKNTYDYIAAEEEYQSLFGNAREFEQSLISNINRKEQRLKETPQADLYYGKNVRIANAIKGRLETFSKSPSFSLLPPDQQEDVLRLIGDQNGILAGVETDFADTTELKAKQLSDKYSKANRRKGGVVSATELQFEEYDKELKTAQEYRDLLVRNIAEGNLTESQRTLMQANLNNANEYLNTASSEINKRKELDITGVLGKIQQQYDDPFAKITKSAESAKEEVSGLIELLQDSYKKQGLSDEEIGEKLNPYEGLLSKIDRNAQQRIELETLQQDARHNQLMRQSNQLARDPFGVRRDIFARSQAMRDQVVSRLEQQRIQQKADINTLSNWQRDNQHKVGTDEYNENAKKLSAAQAALNETEASLGTLSTGWGTAAAAMAQFGQVLDSVVKRLGRQLFNKAIQETKRFVQEYNRGLTSIQMITLKTDAEMGKLGDGLIAKAQELKVTISEVMSSAETLYRQGLNDEEVSERLDVISKFSKVSGTKIDAATKLITVAMNTGLVSNPQTAADIVTALGDSAATNASEIEKGIEKAGAAAAADGTTFAQLASMLTAITSTTQIGGNVAGRTLNTIFGRMNKIGTSELIYDENGNAVSGSAVAKLLKEGGVDTYQNGQKRSSYDVLFDLSQKWDGLSDAKQQQIAAAIAGTRQYSNFSAIMTGMAEGKVSEYMGLTGESGGIVDEKYEVYTRSLEAALIDVRNAWDALVAGLTDKGTLTGFLSTVTNMIKGVTKLSDSFGNVGTVLVGILPLLAAFAAIHIGSMMGPVGIPYVIGGLATAGVMIAGSALIGSQKSASEKYDDSLAQYNEKISNTQSDIARLTALRKKEDRTQSEDKEYAELISNMAVKYSAITSYGDAAAYSVDNLTSAINTMSGAADAAADNVLKAAKAESDSAFGKKVNGNMSERTGALEEDLGKTFESVGKNISLNNPNLQSIIHYDNATGEWVLDENFEENSHWRNRTIGQFAAYKGLAEEAYSRGKITDDELNNLVLGNSLNPEIAQKIIDTLGPGTAPETTESQYVKAAYDAFLPYVQEAMSSEDISSGEIEYLTNEIAKAYVAAQNVGDEHAVATAWYSAFSDSEDPATIRSAVNKALKGYRPERSAAQDRFDLADLGTYDYYVDKNGNVVSAEELELARTRFEQEERSARINAIYDYDTAEVNRQAAEFSRQKEAYEKDKPNRDANAFMMSEYDRQMAAYQRYQTEYSNWQIKKDNYEMYGGAEPGNPPAKVEQPKLPLLLPTVNEPSGMFDSSKLAFGARKARDEIGALIDAGAKALTEAADAADKAAKEIKDKDEYQFTKVTNRFVEALNYSGTDSWLSKNQLGVSSDAIVSLLLGGNFGNGAEGLNNLMRYVNTNSAAGLDWQNLTKGNLDISRIIEQATWDQTAGKYTSAPEDVVAQIYRAARSSSLTFGAEELTTQEKAQLANTAYLGLTNNGWYISEEDRKAAMQDVWSNLDKKTKKQTSFDDYFLVNPLERALSGDDIKYLQEVLGQRMTSRLLEARQGGTSLSAEETSYIEEVLKNRMAGITGYTSSQNLAHMNDVISNMGNLGTSYSRYVADAYMSQWANWNEYADLYGRKDTLEGEELERFNTLSQELETLQKNAEIDIKIEGVKALEDAGKVAEGTTAALEAMAKGGKAAADAMMSLERSGFSEGQSRAKLYKGTQEQQHEAARQLLGMSEEEFYSDVLTNMSAAWAYDQAYQQQTDKNTIEQLFLNANTPEQQAFARRFAYSKGFTIDTSKGDGYAEAVFDKRNLRVKATNPILYASQIYTDKERADALDQIINGTLKYSNENAGLYMAAYENGGAYSKELIRRRIQGLDVTQDIERGARNEQRELSRIYAEDYDLSTAAGMYGYNQAQREWNNRAALSANTIYSELSSGNIKSVQDLMQSVSDHSKDWVNLLDSSEELNKQFSDLGIKYNKETGALDFSNVTASSKTFAAAIEAMAVAAGQASEKFAEITQILSTGETAERALEYLNGTRSDDLGYAAFSEYIGNDSVAAYVKNNRINGRDALAGLEDNAFVSNYVNSLLENARLGISGLTDVQRYEGLMDIVNSSNIGSLYENNMFGAFEDYLQSVSGASDWVNATQVLQQNKMSWADVRNGADLPEQFTKIYGNTKIATEADEAFRNSLLETGRTLKTSGKNLSEYSNGLNISSKDLKTSTSALKNYRSMLATFSNNQFLRNLYRSGNRESRVKEYVKSLGFTEEDFKDVNMQQSILDAMSNEENAEKLDLENTLSGVMDGIQQEVTNYVKSHEIYVDGQQINVGSGSVTVSTDELLSKFEGALELTQNEAVQQALAHGAEIDWQVTWGNNVTTIKPIVKSLGARSSGGGGGGGGGKSKADKLLEAQKHRIEAIQHENNMLEIEADNYARVNNITGYEDTVDKQIAGQEKLRAAYRQNISEIKQQMSNVKKESDDWYKLVEALHSAEEAYAKVAAAIDDLIKKQLQEREQLYSFRTSLSTHEKNMLDVWRNRYTRNNDYNNMNHNIDEQVANARAQQALDIAWANELAAKIQEQYDLGNNDTDTVREWRQNLNEIVEKIANSTEEIAELEASRLNVIQTQRENALVFPEHVSRMYDYDQEMMQLNNNYTGLIRSYDAEYANVRSEYDVWEQSRAQLVDLLASQTIGSTSWYDVRNELFAADEQLKELELELAQIEQNRITEEINYFNARSDWDSGNRQHNLNMIQSEQSYYQSRDELTNYGFMLEKEQEVHQANVEAAQNELVLLNRQREALEEQGMAGTENYNTIIDLIKTREELIRSETATLEENTKKLRENQEAILKTRQELESLIDTEIKTREEERKKRLAATVSMENTILETIKKRYKDEWDLIREDMAKKREALNKEKSLINERLNARKQAASMEEKYSELEEYQRQLALIANDPTRSKDAKQLRDKVQELQKSLSWEEATQEAQASMQTIDDEIKSMADYEAYGTESLNEMLTFADNFSEEISTIMEGGWTSISDFLTRNNEAFINSLDSNQQQMLEGWEQTWKNMKGIVDTYWEQVNEIISSPEMVLAYMMGSTQYQNQSGVGQQLLISQWEDLVRKYLASTAVSPDAQYYEMDDHPWYEGSGDLGAVDDYSWLGQGFSGYDTPENGVNMPVDNGRTIFPQEGQASTSSSSSGKGGGSSKGGYYIAQGIVNIETVGDDGQKAYDYVLHADKSTRGLAYAVDRVKTKFLKEGYNESQIKIVVKEATTEDKYKEWGVFKHGGLVNYTGPAWVDGTPTQPESFLDAADTENLRNLTDALTHVSVSGGVWPGGDDFGGGDINYGDIYVTINQAELKNDADFDAVAKRVGKSFVKEMSRNGFNLTKYNL